MSITIITHAYVRLKSKIQHKQRTIGFETFAAIFLIMPSTSVISIGNQMISSAIWKKMSIESFYPETPVFY